MVRLCWQGHPLVTRLNLASSTACALQTLCTKNGELFGHTCMIFKLTQGCSSVRVPMQLVRNMCGWHFHGVLGSVAGHERRHVICRTNATVTIWCMAICHAGDLQCRMCKAGQMRQWAPPTTQCTVEHVSWYMTAFAPDGQMALH